MSYTPKDLRSAAANIRANSGNRVTPPMLEDGAKAIELLAYLTDQAHRGMLCLECPGRGEHVSDCVIPEALEFLANRL